MIRFFIAALLLVAADSPATEKVLPVKVVVREMQGGGGIGVMFQTEWVIDTDGKWEQAETQQGRMRKVRRSGVLEKKRLETLAEELMRYDVSGLKPGSKLKDFEKDRKLVALKWIEVVYGETKVQFTLGVGEQLGKPDPKTNEGRFAGVVAAVKAAAVKEAARKK